MSYQIRKRWCKRCEKTTHHWRELPDIPRKWEKILRDSPQLIRGFLFVRWHCRGCKGVPQGPLAKRDARKSPHADALSALSVPTGEERDKKRRGRRGGGDLRLKPAGDGLKTTRNRDGSRVNGEGPRPEREEVAARPALEVPEPPLDPGPGAGGLTGSETTDAPGQARAPARGLFLVLDGPDGGGKTTQVADLAEWLRTQGHSVVTCRDPGGTPLGNFLRTVLLDRETMTPTVRAEMLLYMASRAQLVEEVIRPALARGETVISDRYLLANIVYQGDAGGLGIEEVAEVGRVATGGLLPDLTIVLDVTLSLARARVGGPRDRIEDRPDEYHTRVRKGFLRAAEEGQAGGCAYFPAPVVVVDGSGLPRSVAGRIRNEVERALALGPRS